MWSASSIRPLEISCGEKHEGRSDKYFLGDRIGIYEGFYGGFYGDLWVYVYIYIYMIYVCVCVCMYVYIYIYGDMDIVGDSTMGI